jgi:PAS domain S-box-containing protein
MRADAPDPPSQATGDGLARPPVALPGRSLGADIIIANAPDPVFVSDLEGKILQANDAVCQLLGFRPDELVEQSLSKFISPEETREFTAALREVVEKGVTRNARLNPRTAGGEVIPTTLNASALRDPEGLVIGAVGILHDMRELDKARAYAESLIKNAPDPVFVSSRAEGPESLQERSPTRRTSETRRGAARVPQREEDLWACEPWAPVVPGCPSAPRCRTTWRAPGPAARPSCGSDARQLCRDGASSGIGRGTGCGTGPRPPWAAGRPSQSRPITAVVHKHHYRTHAPRPVATRSGAGRRHPPENSDGPPPHSGHVLAVTGTHQAV